MWQGGCSRRVSTWHCIDSLQMNRVRLNCQRCRGFLFLHDMLFGIIVFPGLVFYYQDELRLNRFIPLVFQEQFWTPCTIVWCEIFKEDLLHVLLTFQTFITQSLQTRQANKYTNQLLLINNRSMYKSSQLTTQFKVYLTTCEATRNKYSK